MRIKLLSSNFDENTGISKVTISTRYGEFSGISKLHPEDLEKTSNFIGCRIAEMRAIVKYFKKAQEIVKYKIKGLENFEKILIGRNDYEEHSIENRKLRQYKYILEKELQSWKDKQESLETNINLYIHSRDKVIEDLKKKKEMRENSELSNQ